MSKRYVDIPIGTAHPKFVLRIDRGIENSSRAYVLKEYLEWLCDPDGLAEAEAHQTIRLIQELPREPIRVYLRNRERLQRGYIGAFSKGSAAHPERHWAIKIAYGPDFPDPTMTWSWLATIPHELVHLSAFCDRNDGRRPGDLSVEEFKAERPHQDEEEVAERIGEVCAVFEYAQPMGVGLDDPSLLRGWRKPSAVMLRGGHRQ